MKGEEERRCKDSAINSSPVVLVVAPPGGMDVLDAPTFLGRMPNVGILYLASALEKAGYPCEALDRHYDDCTPFELAAEILSYSPKLIGFTLFDLTMEFTHAVLGIIRKLYDGPIVVGGYTATFHAEDILNNFPEVDYILTHEAEYSLVDLIRALDGEETFESVPNLYWRHKGVIKQTGKGSPVDVTSILWPKRYWEERQDVIPIITRRGCSSACSFCSMVPFYERRKSPVVRFREVDDVVDEIEHLMEKGRTQFMFYDDDFGLATSRDRGWADQFVNEVSRRGLRFQFGIELRVIDILRGEEQLHALCEAGLSHMAIGMESLLPRQLKLYRKGYGQKQALESIEIANRIPAYYQTNILFWDPWITLEEALEHMELLDHIGFQDQLASVNYPFYVSTLSARRGTTIHHDLTEQGVLYPSESLFYRYDYDFQDLQTSAFNRLFLPDFLKRTHRTIKRPHVLWMLLPRLRFHGYDALADELQEAGSALAHVEFEYFRRYVNLAQELDAVTPSNGLFLQLHSEMEKRLTDCAEAFPAISEEVYCIVNDGQALRPGMADR